MLAHKTFPPVFLGLSLLAFELSRRGGLIIRYAGLLIRPFDAGLQLSGQRLVLQMVEIVGLRVLDGIHDDMRIVVLYNTAVLEDYATLDPAFGVFGSFDFDLDNTRAKAKKQC